MVLGKDWRNTIQMKHRGDSNSTCNVSFLKLSQGYLVAYCDYSLYLFVFKIFLSEFKNISNY